MSARLTRLRIAGFKSFAEPVSLDILPGLTGIVGPNGCGKSNVVEALRWAMGETSARALRGGEMDDVIFGGTTARASRNLAEVTVTLDAGHSALPAPFEAEAELQVTRRIERGGGSVFRVNGREARARDVQTLYADLASGARSSGMVSQGRVADLVRARPEERRQVLEEAANITGLHARRHEAELKLRAAEQNLSRAGDQRAQLDATGEGLRRQARQAARYRSISDLIRAAEADHLGILHGRAAAALDRAREELSAASAAAGAMQAEEARVAEASAIAEAALPGLRERAAEARSLLDRQVFAAEALRADAQRAVQEAQSAETRLGELAADLEAAAAAHDDAARAVARLSDDARLLASQLLTLPGQVEAADQRLAAARGAARDAQIEADEANRQESEAAASVLRAEAARHDAEARLARVREQHGTLAAQLQEHAALRVADDLLTQATEATATAEAELLAARAGVSAAEAERVRANETMLSARALAEHEHAKRQAAEHAVGRAAAQAERLRVALATADSALRRHRAERVDAGALRDADDAASRADTMLAEAERTLEAAEQASSQITAEAASAKRQAEDGLSARARAADLVTAGRSRMESAAAAHQRAEAALAEALASIDTEKAGRLAAACEAAALERDAQANALSDADAACRSAGHALEDGRAALRLANADTARLAAEAEGLAAALGNDDGQPGLLDALHVPDGLELAFGAAFGDAVQAALDPSSSMFWRDLPPLRPAALPAGSVALASLLDTRGAPDALSRLLSHVAVLEEPADGDAIQPALATGVVAVDRAGACWRWDGLVTRAGAPNPTAKRLQLRRRHAQILTCLDAVTTTAASADARVAVLEAEDAFHRSRQDAARLAWQVADASLHEARQAADRQQAADNDAASRTKILSQAVDALQGELATAQRALDSAEAGAASLQEMDGLVEAARAADAQASAAMRAVDAARDGRIAARQTEAAARQAAQNLAGQAMRAEAMFDAAAGARERAGSDLDEAARSLAEAEAAAAILPDPTRTQTALAGAEAADARCRAQAIEAHRLLRKAEEALDRKRQAATQLHADHLRAEAHHTGLCAQCERSLSELEAASDQARHAADVSGGLPDVSALTDAAETARTTLQTTRSAVHAAESEALALQAASAQAVRTQDSLRLELDAWTGRANEASARRTALLARHDAAMAAWQALAARPERLLADAAQAAELVDGAERHHRQAGSDLVSADRHFRDVSAQLRDAAQMAAAARENHVRLHAASQAAAATAGAVRATVEERLGPAAEHKAIEDCSAEAEERARRKLERLSRERDDFGPVNLRADLELAELDARMAELERECQDLGAAIAKLRGAIGHLNREGRERLLAVFNAVDGHFRALFTRVMGGGQAHLAMTGADDPLAAGLEIYAEPPGKKLSALSLLSGGEQALTALCLIFAVFRCTPAPVCVLDEVDAPLDDANVERFCILLDEIMRETGTSFLVVTHHQLTMSRMDRLFGVTMQERGVSRLLSVDLRHAAALVQPMLQAAE